MRNAYTIQPVLSDSSIPASRGANLAQETSCACFGLYESHPCAQKLIIILSYILHYDAS